MRFAEHMLLESMNYRLRPYLRQHGDGARCAVGLVESPGNVAENLYSWINGEITSAPCNCTTVRWAPKHQLMPGHQPLIVTTIVHLFNEHVARGIEGLGIIGGSCSPEAEPWTMERLAQWIDSVDPTPRDVIEPQDKHADVGQGPVAASLEVPAL